MRTQIRTRRAHETVSVIYEIEHWWNHKRARDHTDDERDLLLPWRGIDKLAGLQILEVVVRNRRHIEDYRRCEQRERNQRCARIRTDVRFDSHHQKQGGADHDRANKTNFPAPGSLRERNRGRRDIPGHRRKMWHAPAPADEGTDQHRDTNRKTDQMSDPEKRE